MGRIITLKNGEQKSILSIDDVIEIVRDNLGNELTDLIVDELDDLAEEVAYNEDEIKIYEKDCQKYCDVIFSAQIEIGNIIKKLDYESVSCINDTIKLNNNVFNDCIDRLTKVKEKFEET